MSVENSLKVGVDLRSLAPQWGIAYPIIQAIFNLRGYSCVVTSGNDGTHGPHSLHYKGKALDFRTRHIPMIDKLPIHAAMKAALGAQWDVLLEYAGMDNEHCHIEWDPKDTPKSEET